MTLAVGQELPPRRLGPIDPEGMKIWARLLRDPNPIHLDLAVVKAMGLGDRRINQGPANLAYVIDMVQAAVPGARIAELQARYVDNVLEGDLVEAGGRVTAIEGGRVKADVWLNAEGRGPVIQGVVVFESAQSQA